MSSGRKRRHWIFPLALLGGGLAVGLLLFAFYPRREPPDEKQQRAMRELLEQTYPAFVIALHKPEAGALAAAEATVRKQASAFGPETRGAFERLLAAHRAARDRGSDEWIEAINLLNATLYRAGYPFYVDGELSSGQGTTLAILFSFTIEKTVDFATPRGVVRGLYLRRLDRLNWDYGLLAYAQFERDEISVLLDRVEHILRDQVLPALAEEAGRPIWTEEQLPMSEETRVLAAETAAAVQGELGSDSFERIRDRFAFSLARHEVQHVIDNREAGRPLERSQAETSAYMADLARPDGLGTLTLGLLIGYALGESTGTHAEQNAAQVILRELAKELSIQESEPTRLYLQVMKRPVAERERAARAAWERLFKKPLPAITSSP